MIVQKRSAVKVLLVLLLALTLATAAACGAKPPQSPPANGGGAANGEGVEKGDGTLRWRGVAAEDLTGELQAWVDANKQEVGIFQEIADDEAFILIAWGERASAGYAVAVEAATATDPGDLQLFVRLTEPGENEPAAAVITYPYALIAVSPAQYYNVEPLFEGALFLQNSAFKVTKPDMYAAVGDTLEIEGQARVFEATFHVYLEDGHFVLIDEVLMADEGAPAWGAFAAELPLPMVPSSPNGLLMFYAVSAKDGTPIHTLTIPVQFTEWEGIVGEADE